MSRIDVQQSKLCYNLQLKIKSLVIKSKGIKRFLLSKLFRNLSLLSYYLYIFLHDSQSVKKYTDINKKINIYILLAN